MPGKVKDQGKKSAQQLNGAQKLPRRLYETELYRLQGELVKMQEWARAEGARIVIIFEGRDAAGKGSTIKRVTEYLNPRVAQIVALPAPTERERTQWYFQRYVDHLPAAGELALFDRSWYNRAGVEHVMGFCTPTEYSRFLHQCPIFERLLVEDGILLRKYWFSVNDEEQQRFRSRRSHHDPSGLDTCRSAVCRVAPSARHPGAAAATAMSVLAVPIGVRLLMATSWAPACPPTGLACPC